MSQTFLLKDDCGQRWCLGHYVCRSTFSCCGGLLPNNDELASSILLLFYNSLGGSSILGSYFSTQKPEVIKTCREYRVRVLVRAPSNSALDDIVFCALRMGQNFPVDVFDTITMVVHMFQNAIGTHLQYTVLTWRYICCLKLEYTSSYNFLDIRIPMPRRLVSSDFIDPCNNNMLRSTGSNGFKEHVLNYDESTLGINNIKTPAHFHINNNENRTWSTNDVTNINYPKWSAHTANLQKQQPPPFIIPENQMVMPYSESAITCAPSMLKSNIWYTTKAKTSYFSHPPYVTQQCQPFTNTSIQENYIETARPSTDNSTSAQQNFITSRQSKWRYRHTQQPHINFVEQTTHATSSRSSNKDVSQLYIDIGDCDYMCHHCIAIFWYGERTGTTSRSQPIKYSKCCAGGQVRLQKEMEPPMYFKQLLKDKHFLDNIRAYNQMFSMTSFGAHIDDSVNDGRGQYVFKISGEIHHWIGTICPTNINEPKFMQLYIYDTQNEVAHRMEPFGGKDGSGLKPEIVQNLIQILDEHNELVRVFRTARERCNQPNVTEFKIQLYNVVGGRQYQLPTSGTLGAIVIEPDTNTLTDYDVIIEYKDKRPQRISKLHSSYMSLQFPLLFVYGQPGYNTKMTLEEGTKNRKRNKLSMNMYYKCTGGM
ncbi:helitron helicase-like domain-containing protein [Artemisia annua]|uniref:Helitron helicase-like domain-containing protein n=1 Tax=Artemisia annua TaxID=35608 RepID=A0A2U1MCZ7_ARTAN|nr:helitron helicase-like domain-containing protein [Artemisia annua]